MNLGIARVAERHSLHGENPELRWEITSQHPTMGLLRIPFNNEPEARRYADYINMFGKCPPKENRPLKALPVRAGNSIEWYRCACGEESNLVWKYRTNKSSILACSLDCAVAKAKGLLHLHFIVDE